jgi:hypothetical protein
VRGWDVNLDPVVDSESSGSAMLVEPFLCCFGNKGFVCSGHGVEGLHGEA